MRTPLGDWLDMVEGWSNVLEKIVSSCLLGNAKICLIELISTQLPENRPRPQLQHMIIAFLYQRIALTDGNKDAVMCCSGAATEDRSNVSSSVC